ncbi:unnamed protein product [Lactuca virosa]|uniref:Uncharacterized protein n=1 Tax=Lactuca virosa TaxID=75947 RepID=A0AAU9LD26_9ASTR|nr:unnamed protein product [Lactuca virosa]
MYPKSIVVPTTDSNPVHLKAMQQLLDSHKGAACFRDKPFPQFDNLCQIFGKDRATGNGATDLGEDVIEETQKNSPIHV